MKIIGVIVIFVFASFFFYSWNRLHKGISRHVPNSSELPSAYNLPFSTHSFTSLDGTKLNGWYIPAVKPKAALVLVHGYTTDTGGKTRILPHAQYLHNAGYSLFLPDLRSFGESDGSKISFGVKEWQDVVASHDFVKQMPELKNKKVGLYGISMGASTVLVAAGRSGKGDFVVASVPYASIDKMFKYQTKMEKLPVALIFPFLKLSAYTEFGLEYDKYSPEKVVGNITVPVLFHGSFKDEMVAPGDASDLFSLAKGKKEFFQTNTHHDAHLESPKKFEEKTLSFLEKIIK